MLEDETLNKIALVGNEFGTTTGRARKVNWLNLDKLIEAIQISGTTDVIISKVDVLEKIGVWKYYYEGKLLEVLSKDDLITNIKLHLSKNCSLLKKIIFSYSPKTIEGL